MVALLRFKLIGETYYRALWSGHSHIPLRPADRINVKAGDTIGVSASDCERNGGQ